MRLAYVLLGHPSSRRHRTSEVDALHSIEPAMKQHPRDCTSLLQRRCGHTDAKPIASHLLLHSLPLTGRQGPEMKVNRPLGAGELLVKMRRHGVRTIAGIGEHEHFLGARPLEPPSELPGLCPVRLSGFTKLTICRKAKPPELWVWCADANCKIWSSAGRAFRTTRMTSLAVVVIMLVAVYVHLHPDAPAEVLPFRSSRRS